MKELKELDVGTRVYADLAHGTVVGKVLYYTNSFFKRVVVILDSHNQTHTLDPKNIREA